MPGTRANSSSNVCNRELIAEALSLSSHTFARGSANNKRHGKKRGGQGARLASNQVSLGGWNWYLLRRTVSGHQAGLADRGLAADGAQAGDAADT